jgi:hypothetical protein
MLHYRAQLEFFGKFVMPVRRILRDAHLPQG